MSTPILAWHNRPELKAEAVARLKAHRAADTIVQGIYQQVDPESATGYRGCAIGCTLPQLPDGDPLFESNAWWARIEAEYGIPYDIARVIDNMFEGQPTFQAAADFAVAVIEAIPVGADLSDIADVAYRGGYYLVSTSVEDAQRFLADLAAAPVPATAGAP